MESQQASPSKLEAWQQRVLDERAQLGERIVKLQQFVRGDAYRRLSERHRRLLDNQLNAMQQYSYILSQRIELFL